VSKPRTVRLPATLEDLQRGVYVGFSGNAKQRKQHRRRLERLGVTVTPGRPGQYLAQIERP